jgi:hypothetical protein
MEDVRAKARDELPRPFDILNRQECVIHTTPEHGG